jgi:hypothetical protein
VTLLLALGVQIVFLLWPYYQYRFRFDLEHWRIIQRLRLALQLALIFLVLEILAWLLAIARV